MRGVFVAVTAALLLPGCVGQDFNAVPRYGESGFPSNCHALVKAAIEDWRAGKYPAEDAMESIERNCHEGSDMWTEK